MISIGLRLANLRRPTGSKRLELANQATTDILFCKALPLRRLSLLDID
jgi:hypothetical protein